VFPTTGVSVEDFPPTWQIASNSENAIYEELVGIGPDFGGLQVPSWLGDVRIDLDRIRGLFNPDLVVPSTGLVTVEHVARCGLTCFDVMFRPSAVTSEIAYPLEMPLADPETMRVDCGVDPPEIEVRAIEGFDPAWDGRPTGCEAVLSFSRWAWASPYFHLSITEAALFEQTPGPWTDNRYASCFGDPGSPPACDMGHESDALTIITIESVAANGANIVVTGSEWDVVWTGNEYDVHRELGDLSLRLACGTTIDAESNLGLAWNRILDACLLAELFAAGESFPGAYAVYGNNLGEIWGLDFVYGLELP